jgi:hypothetical protein
MQMFSCKGCVPPDRYPGCHGKCEKYLNEKSAYDALKKAEDEKKRVRDGLVDQRNKLYYKAMKNRRAKDRGAG